MPESFLIIRVDSRLVGDVKRTVFNYEDTKDMDLAMVTIAENTLAVSPEMVANVRRIFEDVQQMKGWKTPSGRVFRHNIGAEQRNTRGAVYVMLGDEHPRTRADGFYARARLTMEEALQNGTSIWKPRSPLDGGPYMSEDHWRANQPVADPVFLEPEERVLHLDGDNGHDAPSNLMLFPSQKSLAQWRSAQYHITKDRDYRDRLKGLTEAQKDLRAEIGTKAAQTRELRSSSARKAAKTRKATMRAKKKPE
jgi:hypothetical protein